MKKIYVILCICAAYFSFLPDSKAQDSTKNKNSDHSYLEAGLTYLSNNVYLGRHDSLTIPYLTPSLTYYNKSGFFAGTSLSYLTSAGNSRIDFVELDAGYAFTINKFSAIASAEKDFYNSESKNVRAETKGSLDGTIAYDFGVVKPILQGGIVFGNNNDYYTALGLDHSFYFDDDNFEITPSVLLNASTQNYYSSYFTKRKFKAKRKNQPGGVATKAYLPNAANFKIMDYEFSLPIDYAVGKFTFDLTPKVAVPVNPNVAVITVTPASGVSTTRTKTESLSNIFYWSATVSYDF